jgi:hypothetical protein
LPEIIHLPGFSSSSVVFPLLFLFSLEFISLISCLYTNSCFRFCFWGKHPKT